ncbi:hypothetical protein [Vallitalea maricola]|uniref:Uncharacterized protein n=1 Tax=Vallitalea maricola TaxID=3074433 RepID=A0ACB5UP38_9FIRM|nr:hypothetical protein AN2V17_38580 [Vallitalea sp. AN17-2]
MTSFKIDKCRITILIGIILLVVTSTVAIWAYNQKLKLEQNQLERDVQATYMVMNLLNGELKRYQCMYDRGDIDEVSLKEHQDMIRGICNTTMKIRYASQMSNIRMITPESLEDVDDESYQKYLKMSDYLSSIFEGRPKSEKYEGEEVEYFYNIYISDEFKSSIEQILS